MSALVIENVSRVFPGVRRGAPTRALEPTSLAIADNDLVTILGPSGCGKSTLLRLIAGLDQPTTGRIVLDGKPVSEPGPDRETFYHRDAGNAQALQRVDKAVELRFVGKAIVPAGEVAELRNVSASNKSLAASATEHGDPYMAILVDRRAGCGETVVHRPGHRVARPRPIELNVRHFASNAQRHLSVAGWDFCRFASHRNSSSTRRR